MVLRSSLGPQLLSPQVELTGRGARGEGRLRPGDRRSAGPPTPDPAAAGGRGVYRSRAGLLVVNGDMLKGSRRYGVASSSRPSPRPAMRPFVGLRVRESWLHRDAARGGVNMSFRAARGDCRVRHPPRRRASFAPGDAHACEFRQQAPRPGPGGAGRVLDLNALGPTVGRTGAWKSRQATATGPSKSQSRSRVTTAASGLESLLPPACFPKSPYLWRGGPPSLPSLGMALDRSQSRAEEQIWSERSGYST